MTIPSFDQTHVHKLAEALESSVSHRELTDILAKCQIQDAEAGSKEHRIHSALLSRQRQDGCGNNVAAFIQAVADPVRFVGRSERFTSLCESLNQILAFSGLSIGQDGKLKAVKAARTLAEAEERAGRLKIELTRRRVHPDVLKFCNAEWLQDNYFHAVLEATKSVAEKIRDLTGLPGDGAELVDPAFGIANPILALNKLQTDTEKSEQKGFANLLRGMFGTFRNVTGHAPKISWTIGEQDALDLLSLVSYLHRRLDSAVRIPKP